MEVLIIKQAQRELKDVPSKLAQDIYGHLNDLAAGKQLSMPTSRPLFSIAKGLHELRMSFSGGEYRVFYVMRVKDAIYVVHAGTKKTGTIDRSTVQLLLNRIRSL